MNTQDCRPTLGKVEIIRYLRLKIVQNHKKFQEMGVNVQVSPGPRSPTRLFQSRPRVVSATRRSSIFLIRVIRIWNLQSLKTLQSGTTLAQVGC